METQPKPTKFVNEATLLECMKVKRVEQSPYKKTGPGLPASVWEQEGEGFVWVRVDMPGVNLSRVYLDPNDNSINFHGWEEEITMHGIGKDDTECRDYKGSAVLDYGRFNGLIDYGYQFGNGVLLIRIKCEKPPPNAQDLGVTLKTHQLTQEIRESAYNPFVTHGKDRYKIHSFDHKGAFVMAVDTPGLGEEDNVTLNTKEDGIISFSVKSVAERYINDELRHYEGHFKVNTEEFDCDAAECHINNGVFWIQVPRRVKTPMEDRVKVVRNGFVIA